MLLFFRKNAVVAAILAFALVGVSVFAFLTLNKKAPQLVPVATKNAGAIYKVIGTSVEGRKIESYRFGSGEKHLVFAGGMHGGYEWNSVLLAYTFMDYLNGNPEAIPKNVTVTVIPSLNPDGVFKVTGKEGRFQISDVSTDKAILESGRMNARGVDLNRNFDCKWKPEATWKSKTVSAGTEAFSEPEAKALRNFVAETHPDAVIFWHSQANAVYASECKEGILPATLDIMNAYSAGSGYRPVKSFDAYEVTGDSEGWLASIGVPAITVELQTHETIEWERNLAGIKALLEYYGRTDSRY
ncbi:MAG: M14 family zinc carboxypeptidase [Candidatus Kaiserbacteria bacterium]|nr:M14 family zinc carboxypeptidase [Candidatus Kaiserbacteria bacterium]